jgi:hypothetical protein
MLFANVLLPMRSCDMLPLVAVGIAVITLCTLFSGCTSLQNIGQNTAITPEPTQTGTAPVITPIVTTGPEIQAPPTESIRKKASDTEFLLAIDDSQLKILNQIETINAELVKDSSTGGPSQDYTALGSYARRLFTSADEEILKMSKFREISDTDNEYRRDYYVNYLTRLKPFAANLETGAGLAQKKDFNTASGFFSNANNDLSLVRSQELPGHLKVITRIKESLGPFMDAIQQQGTTPAPK